MESEAVRMSAAAAAMTILFALHTGTFGQEAQPDTVLKALNPLAGIKPGDFSAFVDRPLFSPSRRKPVVEPLPADNEVAVETPEAPALDLKLLGVTSSPTESIALVSEGDSAQSLRQGDTIGGWTVESVEPAAVVLVRNEERLALRLFARDGDAEGVAEGDSLRAEPDTTSGVTVDTGETELSEDRPVRIIPSK